MPRSRKRRRVRLARRTGAAAFGKLSARSAAMPVGIGIGRCALRAVIVLGLALGFIAGTGAAGRAQIGPVCGDGIVDIALGEQCDEGAANGATDSCCTPTCPLPAAGEGCPAAAGGGGAAGAG